MKRNVSVVCVSSSPNCCDKEHRSASNILISGKIIKEMSGSVASGTPYIFNFEMLFNAACFYIIIPNCSAAIGMSLYTEFQ